jgi:hypothetical protein
MSSVKTNWHLGDLELPDDSDPMAEIAELKSGDPIDLSQSVAQLEADLQRTLRRESRVFNTFNGLECRLKWAKSHKLQGGSKNSCFTCPHYRGDARGEENDGRALICRIGREQEGLVIELDMLRRGDQLDGDFIAAVELDIDRSMELAEASAIDSAAELAEATL